MTERPPFRPSAPLEVLARPQLLLFLPMAGFTALALVFTLGPSHDPSKLPSALIGADVPETALPPVKGPDLGLSTRDLFGVVSLVNVLASWCLACREEDPVFLEIFVASAGGPIVYTHIGGMTHDAVDYPILPLVERLPSQAKGPST